jgi:dTDP-4-amino-4,6-dideoxygalactose transaminase
MHVPFNDLAKHHRNLEPHLSKVIADVIENSQFIRGPHVEEFEKSFSELMNIQHCISCANGTDALYIALKALELKSGQEVIVPAHSWISTSEVVTQAGGVVVFCDTKPNEHTIDTSHLRSKITKNTVGIIPVHLYGQAADMDEIMAVASEYKLWVIEDCAQAHLATYKGKKVGSIGDVGTFSFYPGKNLGAIGDAGAIITNRSDLAVYMAKFARHGGLTKGVHDIEGINSRMDGLQAAVLNLKLKHIERWTEQRQFTSNKYLEMLRGIPGLVIPTLDPNKTHVWHLFVIEHIDRNGLAEFLQIRGVQDCG